MTTAYAIETQNITFAYEGHTPVINGVSVRIEHGEYLAIIGQNGSGKTTLVKHFNGLLRPATGKVLVNGEPTSDQSIGTLARQVGYVFQNPDHQIFSPSVREEIEFGPRNLKLNEDEILQRTEATLDEFGLREFANFQPAMLGFGMRRKVSIAAVRSMQTPILILDEPTTGLDQKTINELMRLISKLHEEGTTIIFITHDMRVVANHIPRCMVVRGGEVITHDDTRTVFSQVEMLGSTHIELPQITELGRRMNSHGGIRPTVLKVPEFCQDYAHHVKTHKG